MHHPIKTRVSQCLLVLLATSIMFVGSHAQGFASDPILNFLNQSRTDNKRNHQLCFAYEDPTPGLPCNPAFLGLERKSTAWIYGFGNNNLHFFQDVADIVRGPIKARELLAIVDHNSHDNFQAELSLGYASETWGVNFIPDKLTLFTNFRNPALPRITVLAARERELQFQLGSFFNPEWSWGLQFRGVNRRFTYSDAYFSDHLTDEIDFLYAVMTQNALYLEPSLLYAPQGTQWKPLFSAMITNLGKADRNFQPYEFQPAARIGISAGADSEYGAFTIGATAQWLRQADVLRFNSGFGLDYNYSILQLFGTVSEFEELLGVGLNFDNVTTSISYAEQDWSYLSSSKTISLWRWDVGFRF